MEFESAARDVFDDRLYLAYGSNLNIGQMSARCPSAVPVRSLVLKDWRLVFRGWADIVPSYGSAVHGALYRVSSAEVAALDRYEEVADDVYRQVNLILPETGERAFCYVMSCGDLGPPTDIYLDVIARGFLDWDLDLGVLAAAVRPEPGV